MNCQFSDKNLKSGSARLELGRDHPECINFYSIEISHYPRRPKIDSILKKIKTDGKPMKQNQFNNPLQDFKHQVYASGSNLQAIREPIYVDIAKGFLTAISD